MAKTYANAAAFLAALSAHLRKAAEKRNVSIASLRDKLAIERLLARLFHEENPPWLLKGGYSMELRFRPKARTTRDIDLAVIRPKAGHRGESQSEVIHEALQDAAAIDLADFFEFHIEPEEKKIKGAPGGGGMFKVHALVDGREFTRVRLDVGFGDPVIGEGELLEGDNLLDFAGIAPAKARAISMEQQFAEKIHAYTVEWSDRENTRQKDLVDIVVLIERGRLDPAALRHALRETFCTRARQELPAHLSPPPESWAKKFPEMSEEAGTSTRTSPPPSKYSTATGNSTNWASEIPHCRISMASLA